MFKKQLDPFARVDKALSVFRSTVDELTAAAAEHAQHAVDIQTQANDLAVLAAKHNVAASTATKTANKIAEFLA